MKGDFVILCLSMILLEFVNASSEIENESDSQNTTRYKKKYIERPLAEGDTFTARELLPVALKLFEKVQNPGSGKGIVSSAKRPQDLADKLFEGFFLTNDRIVTLTDLDITGLDALQSLALVGEPATRTQFAKRPEEKINNKQILLNGQLVEINNQSKVSQYKVLNKKSVTRAPIDREQERFEKSRRGGKSNLLKKMGKNRHLIVQRRNMNKKSRTSPCRWSYECKEPTDLETCVLKAKCTSVKPTMEVDHNKYINSKIDINPVILAQFRKSLSITALDEEVEKILENRMLKLRPQSYNDIENVESLSEYFANIANMEANSKQNPTTPMQKESNNNTSILRALSENNGDREQNTEKSTETDIQNQKKGVTVSPTSPSSRGS